MMWINYNGVDRSRFHCEEMCGTQTVMTGQVIQHLLTSGCTVMVDLGFLRKR